MNLPKPNHIIVVSMPHLISTWTRFTAPSRALTEPIDKRTARNISGISLVLLIVAILCVPMALATASADSLSGINKAVLLFGACYGFSRTKYFRMSAILAILYINLQVIGQLFFTEIALTTIWLTYLLIPIALSTAFRSQKVSIFVALVNVAVLIYYPRTQPVDGTEVIGAAMPVALVAAVIFIVDSQRRRLENRRLLEVLETESNLRAILETTFHGTIVLQNDVIKDVSGGFLRLFDVARSQAKGKPITGFLKDSEQRLPLDLTKIERGVTTEISGKRYNNTWFDAEIVVQDRTHRGEEATILAVRNITEKKQTAIALQQAQRLDSLGVLAGGIAHDFNNLLTGIMAQQSLAQIKLKHDLEAARHMQKSAESARRASDLTRQLLAYAGKGKVSTNTFDIQPLIQESINLVLANSERKTRFEFNHFSEPLLIEADLGQIQQVVLNLFINASEAIESNDGAVSISARPFNAAEGSNKPIPGWVGPELEPKEYIEICVRDTGKGMDAKTKTRIFEPFFTTKATGTGLGLAATLGVIRTHDGAIQATSRLGEGTTFYVYLPLAHPIQTLPDLADPLSQNHSLRNLSVLAIDDKEDILDTISSVLALNNNRVLTASTGERGLALLWENRSALDLIILDMQMPGMDGEATFKEIRNICNIPVLISSGYSETDGISRLLEQPAVTFLQKPYEAHTLNEAVDSALQTTLQIAM